MSHLTTPQLLILKTAILTEIDVAFVAFRTVNDRPSMATWFNGASTFIVWRSAVSIRETGQAFNGAEWAAMSGANHTRLQTVAQYLTSYNASLAGIRAMFDDIWSGPGGALTTAALQTLWKRAARRVEKLYASGTGLDATPGALVFEGTVNASDIGESLEAV